MSSFFEKLTQTIAIDAENKITVVAPTYAQVQAANSKAMKMTMGIDGTGGGVDFDMAAMEVELMKACISSWEGPGFDGRPVTVENICALPSFVIEAIRPAVNALTKGMSETEKKL